MEILFYRLRQYVQIKHTPSIIMVLAIYIVGLFIFAYQRNIEESFLAQMEDLVYVKLLQMRKKQLRGKAHHFWLRHNIVKKNFPHSSTEARISN